MVSTMPLFVMSSARSWLVHWLIGRPVVAGAARASATTWQTWSAVIRADARPRRVGQPLRHAPARQRDVLQRRPAVTPQPHALPAQPHILDRVTDGASVTGRQHDPRPCDHLLSARVPPHHGLQTLAFVALSM